MAKIAVAFESGSGQLVANHSPGQLVSRLLACGDGWRVCDVTCSAGPQMRPREEQHGRFCIAIVRSGTFQYRSNAGCELMTPGSLLLGNPGQYFECGHEYGIGDHCISFTYEPRFMNALVAETLSRAGSRLFSRLRVPAVRELSGVVSRACARRAQSRLSSLDSGQARAWEEIALELAMRALEFANGSANRGSSSSAEARVTRVVRMIEDFPTRDHSLGNLARDAKLSRYHFLRIFQQLTGLTPHQYVRRTRLRHAATRLLLEPSRIVDVALDSGFGDVSNFNHAFISEFALNPRLFRKNAGRHWAV